MPLDNGHGDGHGGGRKVGRNDPCPCGSGKSYVLPAGARAGV